MRKVINCLFIIILTLVLLTNSISAQVPEEISPYWTNTRRVIIGHTYDYGYAHCLVDIKGVEDVDSIQNVDIVYSVNIDGLWVELARWDDLSAVGNEFYFEATVPNVYLSYTYRLSFCADVHRNGTIEWLNDYYDNTY